MTQFLTILEAATELRISRNSAYAAAKEFRRTKGESGLANFKIGGSYRVPRAAIDRLMEIDLTHDEFA